MTSHEHSASRTEKEPKPCIFCEINSGRETSSKIAESKSSVAIMSLEGYPLVIPNAHITPDNIEDNIEDIKDAYGLAFSLIPAAKAALNASGISVISNLGRSAGQVVSHLHIHLVNRNTRDKKVVFSPAPLFSRAELDTRAQKIRENMK